MTRFGEGDPGKWITGDIGQPLAATGTPTPTTVVEGQDSGSADPHNIEPGPAQTGGSPPTPPAPDIPLNGHLNPLDELGLKDAGEGLSDTGMDALRQLLGPVDDAGDTGEPSDTPGEPSSEPTGEPKSTSDWESDANPYKAKLAEAQAAQGTPSQQYDAKRGELMKGAETMLQQLLDGPVKSETMDQETAVNMVKAEFRAADAELKLQMRETAMAPIARDESARRITNEVNQALPAGAPQLTTDALLKFNTVEEMQAASKIYADTVRGQKYQTRQTGGADRTERAPFDTSQLSNKLSGVALIEAGLRAERGTYPQVIQ